MKPPIKIKMNIAGGENSVIPKGVMEVLQIEVVDEIAVYRFNDAKTTKRFAIGQNEDGVESKYNERLQKTICKYPDMSQEDIIKPIQQRLKDLGAKKG